jgi:hypothetical protein
MNEARMAGLAAVAQDADLVLAEGSMGLFDGVAVTGETGNGASAEIAARAGWPVVLVLDVSGRRNPRRRWRWALRAWRRMCVLQASSSTRWPAPGMRR